VRALVIAHGGSVRYEDTPGGGATFVCTFPPGPA
jgi:signal transduction histidine kinase